MPISCHCLFSMKFIRFRQLTRHVSTKHTHTWQPNLSHNYDIDLVVLSITNTHMTGFIVSLCHQMLAHCAFIKHESALQKRDKVSECMKRTHTLDTCPIGAYTKLRDNLDKIRFQRMRVGVWFNISSLMSMEAIRSFVPWALCKVRHGITENGEHRHGLVLARNKRLKNSIISTKIALLLLFIEIECNLSFTSVRWNYNGQQSSVLGASKCLPEAYLRSSLKVWSVTIRFST